MKGISFFVGKKQEIESSICNSCKQFEEDCIWKKYIEKPKCEVVS